MTHKNRRLHTAKQNRTEQNFNRKATNTSLLSLRDNNSVGWLLLPEIAQYSPYYLLLNVFTASKGSNLYILSFCILHEQVFEMIHNRTLKTRAREKGKSASFNDVLTK